MCQCGDAMPESSTAMPTPLPSRRLRGRPEEASGTPVACCNTLAVRITGRFGEISITSGSLASSSRRDTGSTTAIACCEG